LTTKSNVASTLLLVWTGLYLRPECDTSKQVLYERRHGHQPAAQFNAFKSDLQITTSPEK